MEKNLCIIPARGGSKRIPRKNIKLFLGKPIIAYSIEAALKSELFDEVIVSTEDQEIAAIAEEYGAKVPFYRSAENADDFATTFDVIKEVLGVYAKKGKEFDKTCCIYPCAPFVTSKHIKNGFKLLNTNNFDTVFPVIPFSFPIQRALSLDETGKLKMISPENMDVRSQDLNKTYHDSGQFYWMQSSKVLTSGKIITDNCGALIISELEAQDIDSLTDWKIAELKYRLLENELNNI